MCKHAMSPVTFGGAAALFLAMTLIDACNARVTATGDASPEAAADSGVDAEDAAACNGWPDAAYTYDEAGAPGRRGCLPAQGVTINGENVCRSDEYGELCEGRVAPSGLTCRILVVPGGGAYCCPCTR